LLSLGKKNAGYLLVILATFLNAHTMLWYRLAGNWYQHLDINLIDIGFFVQSCISLISILYLLTFWAFKKRKYKKDLASSNALIFFCINTFYMSLVYYLINDMPLGKFVCFSVNCNLSYS
jgi:hypothetical protein